MTGLFQGVAEATEEAIYNSLFMATTVSARGGTVEAIPVAEVVRIVDGHGIGAAIDHSRFRLSSIAQSGFHTAPARWLWSTR